MLIESTPETYIQRIHVKYNIFSVNIVVLCARKMAVIFSTVLAVLVVIAHPDDETLFGGLIHALTHKFNASVDLICVTNGEGGFAHAQPSESFYDNLKLSTESVGRKHLPRIRQQELLGSGRILSIRKYFFFDQRDLKSTRDINQIFTEQWDKEWVIERFQRTIKNGNGVEGYDLMLVILPNVDSHGHHTASALLALEAVERLQRNKSANITIPTVIGGSEYVLTQPPTYSTHRLAQVLTNVTTSRGWHSGSMRLNSVSEVQISEGSIPSPGRVSLVTRWTISDEQNNLEENHIRRLRHDSLLSLFLFLPLFVI